MPLINYYIICETVNPKVVHISNQDFKMASSMQQDFEISSSDESGSDECECDDWWDIKEAALKEFFKTRHMNAEFCEFCFFKYFSSMYNFVPNGKILHDNDFYCDIHASYDRILRAYITRKDKVKQFRFDKEFYELFYEEVSKLLSQFKKLPYEFPHSFAGLHRSTLSNLRFCGGIKPSTILAHQKF